MPRGRPRAARVARGAGRDRRAGRRRAVVDAADRAAADPAARGRRRRAGRVPGAPARRADAGRLHRLALVPDGDLQGALRGRAALAVLPRPARAIAASAVRDLPPALLDEHRSVLGARAAVPPALPQRRDQRDPGQRQLDARPRGQLRLRGRRAPASRDRRVRLRLGDARQRARAARPPRPRRAPRADDARPRSLGRKRRARRAAARLLPLPLAARRAVGRPGGPRVHGRPRRRRGARPERAAAAALRGLRGRAGRVLLGGGRGRPLRARPGPAGPARAGPDDRGRPAARPRGERRAQAPARRAPAVRALARAGAPPRLERVAGGHAGRRT